MEKEAWVVEEKEAWVVEELEGWVVEEKEAWVGGRWRAELWFWMEGWLMVEVERARGKGLRGG